MEPTENEFRKKKSNISDCREDVPIPTPSKIVIPSREQSYTFDKNSFREEYLGRIISREKFNELIDKFSKTMGHAWSKKRLNDQIKLPKLVIWLSVLSVLLAVVYMICLFISTTSEDGGIGLFVVAIISVSCSTIIALGLSIYNFTRKIGRFKSLDEIIQEEMDKELVKVNVVYADQLEFIYIPSKKWIELNILKPDFVGDRDEKRMFINAVEEEPENEDEYASKRHSRNPSKQVNKKMAVVD